MFTRGQIYWCTLCDKKVYRIKSVPAFRSICETSGYKTWLVRVSWKPRWW